ncbi:MAG: S46 family peptidase [Bacteroidales bacterium]|nr:S46 family peptidase [Bacteroidales bacterium]
MKKFLMFVFGVFLSVSSLLAFTPPDEGMWLPMFVDRLNYLDMNEMGLKLTAEEIYSINNSSLKDAIVGLSEGPTPGDYFCTGGIVSDQGLLFTNHHCGYDIIQKHSSVEHDYLYNGFWAGSFDEELPNEGLSASFLVKMDDVTDSIVPFLSDSMSSGDRQMKIREITGRLEDAESEDGKYNVVVKSFFEGNEYYRFVYLVYEDVRLVGAPPSSIGKFGGDTDNWMWPRQTGDFSIFRVYSNAEGFPAPFSEDNVPLKPKSYLPISLKGVEKDDFTMIWGYPGSTDRYASSYGVDFVTYDLGPSLIDMLGLKLEIMKEDMDADRQVNIQYASTYASLANGWKYYIGQVRGLKRLKVADKKRELEERFMAWVEKDEARKEKYGNILTNMEKGYGEAGKNIKPFLYMNLGLMSPDIINYSQDFTQFEQQLNEAKENPEAPKTTAEQLREAAKEHFKDYNAPTDEKIMAGLYKKYLEDIPAEQQPDFFLELQKKYNGDYDKMAREMFEESIFSSMEKVNAFLDKPKAKTLAKDPVYQLAKEVFESFMATMNQYRTSQGSLGKDKRLFVQGLREMQPDKVFYPDANSTMRLSYGTVEDYYPADAVRYDYVTNLSGVMEKEDPNNEEFIVPEKLKELFTNKDYGRYGTDGRLITCFLTTNDITGGNSGSPVINGNGELIGLAFDGNWEAMSGDIVFEPELQRTICVDSRYILFVIDKYAGAKRLIDELTIIQ